MTGFETNPYNNLKPLISGLVSLKPLIKQRIGYFYLLQSFTSEPLYLALFEHNFGHSDSSRVQESLPQ